MRISDWSSDVCSSDLAVELRQIIGPHQPDEPPLGVSADQRAEGFYRISGAEPLFDRGRANRRAARHHLRGTEARPKRGHAFPGLQRDRTSVVEGKSVYVRVDLGGRRIINKKIT